MEPKQIFSIFDSFCWSWLTEERVDEFVVEKYIGISISTSTGIVCRSRSSLFRCYNTIGR